MKDILKVKTFFVKIFKETGLMILNFHSFFPYINLSASFISFISSLSELKSKINIKEKSLTLFFKLKFF